MMGRIIGRHPRVHTFNELHFFEQLWEGDDADGLPREHAVALMARLLTIERDGYLHQGDPTRFTEEAATALSGSTAGPVRGTEVFRRFLGHEVERTGAEIACDQTPRNVFYLEEIHETFPRCRVVHMVRDPRDVLLSQKNKWRRRFLGGGGIPVREALRSWINYHPVTISQLWKASVKAGLRFAGEPWLRTVHFEDLLAEPEAEMREVCHFAGIDYSPDLLRVPRVGSSNVPDRPEERGIDPGRASSWREGGLSDTEIWTSQLISGDVAVDAGYDPAEVRANPLGLAASALAFPLKTGAAVLANLGRYADLVEAVRRRLR